MPSVTDLGLAKLFDEVGCDILTKNQEADNALKLEEISRAFISDTLTVPTKEMNEYGLRASLGDDVYFDESTAVLEAHIAKITGKEAGLFLPTGTMSNQVALRTHLQQPPHSVITDARAHIYRMEAGGVAFHSQANSIPIFPENGHHLTWEDIEPRIVSGTDVHVAPTRVIALENTLNGTIIPQEDVCEISKNARAQNIIMHLDGARIWHVAIETRMSMKEICDPFDTVSLCFSKGLGAPIGTCLVGPKPFITKARWFRKLFGGGMRQTGYLVGCAAYALTHNFPLLPRVHALARRMQRGLEDIGVGILSPAETCILFYDPAPIGVEYWEIVERAAALEKPINLNGSRIVMHIQTSSQAIEDFLDLVRTLKEEKAKAGWTPDQAPRKKQNPFRDVYVKAVRPN
ncbi:pyridoxal phosphate-dependent transferase [Boletus edulis BED1]|uniref:Pyridoxal phosphate-dependent transferase n=1 Tax=Boletus edulis BED1 TaxID=1328754 RepID=A0AAD4C1U4_BOLED|nr:pyridoxal phosphate-dependent transferase [Boletus edulis BED1]